MELITIYTPIFNRANLLPRVYTSLCRQTYKNFIWLVVDDGSTDNVASLVDSWMEESPFKITYLYKHNQGVHAARDLAYQECVTELIVGCDSDDWLVDDAVESWTKCWENKDKENYLGIISAVINSEGKRTIPNYPKVYAASVQDFVYRYKCKGEKHTVVRADVMRKIPKSPIFEGEKLVGENYKWMQLPVDGQFLILDKPTRVYEQQEDGYIKNVAKSRFKNANGFRAEYRQYINNCKYLLPRIKGYMGYIAFSLILRDKAFLKNSPKPFVTFIFLPLGFGTFLVFWLKKFFSESNFRN